MMVMKLILVVETFHQLVLHKENQVVDLDQIIMQVLVVVDQLMQVLQVMLVDQDQMLDRVVMVQLVILLEAQSQEEVVAEVAALFQVDQVVVLVVEETEVLQIQMVLQDQLTQVVAAEEVVIME
jgi:hypothetical protein